MRVIFGFLCIAAALTACGRFEEADRSKVTYFGLGSSGPETGPGGTYITDSSVIGFWIETAEGAKKPTGGGVGWRRKETIAVPIECKAVFIVENEEQLEQAAAMVRELKNDGGDICAVQK